MSDWSRFQKFLVRYEDLGFSLDISRMKIDEDFFHGLEPSCQRAFSELKALEAGEIVNTDEQRMVGHYWLRSPELAPTPELRKRIEEDLESTLAFAQAVHSGKIQSEAHGKFTDVLLVGIGGSALGPQLVSDALTDSSAPLGLHFFDNTDPDGMDRLIGDLGDRLKTTLTVVISKSGGTKETRNGMLEAKAAYEKLGLNFSKHAVAVTGVGSQLDQYAVAEGWIKRFPMEDWVGGRTSVMSTVGLVPATLQGVDVLAFLQGAREMDEKTRTLPTRENAAMLLALAWHSAGKGRGGKDMVILPYKDRLLLMSKYLQQLVMESLGKELDRSGRTVNQGIAVYGNKGSTDQHAYIQQLRDGVNNFFATFIEVRKARHADSIEVDPGFTSGDYLQGFLRGTRHALSESGRENLTISIEEVSARSLGQLIALYERAVTFYASLVNVNAYHQPGVEAGKKAAGAFLDLLAKVRASLTTQPKNADEIASELAAEPEAVYHALIHLSSNQANVLHVAGVKPADDRFLLES